MTPNPLTPSSHPDELLPWFVNNTLSPDEREEVQTHVHGCLRCQHEVRLLEQVQSQVKKTPVDSPGELGLHRLLAKVHQDQEHVVLQVARPWWQSGIAIAASLIIVFQAGLLLDAWYFSKPVVPLEAPKEAGVVLQVSFAPTALELEIRETLSHINGVFIGGPGQLGVYRIRLHLAATDEDGIRQALESLRQQEGIVTHVAKE